MARPRITAVLGLFVVTAGCLGGKSPPPTDDTKTGPAADEGENAVGDSDEEAPPANSTGDDGDASQSQPPKRLNQSVHLIVNGPRQPPGSIASGPHFGENCFEIDASSKATIIFANFTLVWRGTPTAQRFELRLNNLGAKGSDAMTLGTSPVLMSVSGVEVDPERDATVIVQAADATTAPPQQAADLKLDILYSADEALKLGSVYGCQDTSS